MIDLVEDSGARVCELVQLKIGDIPSEYALLEALDKDDSRWEIELIRKGGRKLKLYFSSDVLLEARFYLKFRSALITARKITHPDYSPPDDLFLSEKTGLGLKSDSVSKIVSRLFKKIGVKRVGIHRIRAKFAIDTIDRILDEYLASGLGLEAGSAWVDTIIQQAAHLMGHRSTSSLKHYLHDALDRRLRMSRKHESLQVNRPGYRGGPLV
ncbi:site-specific integrase [Aquincola tertiaricarbonis]|uniref:Site-specific integrase n=1 Tax=Aquincola tertiaricarbonis TaxID=391953 RepID=A0ABY4SIH8_AQUTE|nr:site-specific integrase [Aquincola tertiaricarbonis]URI11613.1 site-specific integrase [Aquincola tertiaricarbonis]